MGRSFANLHIKSDNLEKTVEALRELSTRHGGVLGYSKAEAPESQAVMYVSQSNESWVSVLHEYLVWGTVKKVGKALSGLIKEPVMTAGYMNEEIFELSFFEQGELAAERIFCEPWTREEYGQLREERVNDGYLQQVLNIQGEAAGELIRMTSPDQAVEKLSEIAGMSLWCDYEWIPYEETLQARFAKYEFGR
ncbi:hypothetical protein HQN87_14340 [Paenibacillus tritici]|uniref:Uncharacterized protein n=1 Tax=Paenibacillus tritici TaxID=1873425 RepID=A0ABX2DQS3_9BACL|nr:hypothetical protein [Paenibacillus tritici]